MKNQYFGDVNDYRKYGLLRLLAGGTMTLGVCWMLTKHDGRNDGKFRSYLQNPARYRWHDPELFDWLRNGVGKDDIRRIEQSGLLGKAAQFHTDFLTDKASERDQYFDAWNRKSRQCDIVFFDPDNGIQVKVEKGKSNSCKYVYYDELKAAYDGGSSVLVYQHFIREKRDMFIDRMADSLKKELNAKAVFSFRTPHVLFLLAAQPWHVLHFDQSRSAITSNWKSANTKRKAEIIPFKH